MKKTKKEITKLYNLFLNNIINKRIDNYLVNSLEVLEINLLNN